MNQVNPYEPPQSESVPSAWELPEIFVDGKHLVVASGVELPPRCVKTNEPMTKQDLVQASLQWRGRTMRVLLSIPTCELRWCVKPRYRWRRQLASLGHLLLFVVFLLVMFGIDNGWLSSGWRISAVVSLLATGTLMLFAAQPILRVVDYRQDRFWIEGCCPAFLDRLDRDLQP